MTRSLLCSFAVLGLVAAAAVAQPRPFGTGQQLRLEGIVDPPDGASTLGTIRIRAGDVVRRFGVLRAQTPQVEGMSLFNRSELHPEQVLLRGDRAQMATFQNAPAGSTLRMLGQYMGDDYLLAEITGGAPATPSP
ncbi:hypothetical protein KF840_26205 [bacterium]|nr:hypothetical protein [bacterium]